MQACICALAGMPVQLRCLAAWGGWVELQVCLASRFAWPHVQNSLRGQCCFASGGRPVGADVNNPGSHDSHKLQALAQALQCHIQVFSVGLLTLTDLSYCFRLCSFVCRRWRRRCSATSRSSLWGCPCWNWGRSSRVSLPHKVSQFLSFCVALLWRLPVLELGEGYPSLRGAC